jgi:hypothetical protein
MTKFKIGDKVKVKKLSEKEFEEIYIEKYKNKWYNVDYLNLYSANFGKVYTIAGFSEKREFISLLEIENSFYPEELIKINNLKTRLQLIRELIK